MIRNPKAFEVWSACSCNVHYVITDSEMPLKRILQTAIHSLGWLRVDKKGLGRISELVYHLDRMFITERGEKP